MKYLKTFENYGFNPDDIIDFFQEIADNFSIPQIEKSKLDNILRDGESHNPEFKYFYLFKNIFDDYIIDVKCGKDNIISFKDQLNRFRNRLSKLNMITSIDEYTAEWAKDSFKVLISNNPNSKSFEEMRSTLPFIDNQEVVEKLLPYDMSNFYNGIDLYKVADRIYCVVIKDQHKRAMTFLRFQEYYESPSSEFRGQKFKWDRYIQWYNSSEGPTGEKDVFTYGSDWTGFNLPSESIENCMKDIDDKNSYDDTIISIVKAIKKNEKDNYYLIAVDKLDTNSSLLDHEMAHGFYYTDIDYRNEMNRIISEMPDDVRMSIGKSIIDIGYSDTVLNDEIQAYMSTGIISSMDDKLENYTDKFKKAFFKCKQKHHAHPKKIDVVYESH